jgi:hypothetical protein
MRLVWSLVDTSIGAGWAGPSLDETLEVSVVEIVPDGNVSAPLGVEFEITVTGSTVGDRPGTFPSYDPTFTRIHYVVHTGDTGNYRNERVGHSSHRNKAFEYGQNPGHVYSNAGTYTNRSVYVYDENGKWGTFALPNLTVLSPEAVYSAARTIVVSNDVGETWTGAPPHDVANRCTSLAAAFSRFNVLTGVGIGIRICLKAGTTYTEAHLTAPDRHRNHNLFDTWGGTARAVVTQIGNATPASTGGFFTASNDGTFGFSVKNWSFNFGWDAFNEAPPNGYGSVAADMAERNLFRGSDKFVPSGNVGYRLTFDNLDVEGCAAAVFNSLDGDQFRRSAYFINDCKLQRNMDYFVYQGSNLFITGTEIVEEYGVGLGLMGRYRLAGLQRGGRAHRSLRDNVNWVIYIRAAFIEGRGGWSGQEADKGRTFYAPQGIFRLDNGEVGQTGRRVYICDSVLGQNIGLTNANAGAQVVLENCLVMHDPAQRLQPGLVSGITGGMAVRNNQFLVLDTPVLTEAGLSATKNVAKFDSTVPIEIGSIEGTMLQVANRTAAYTRALDILHNTVVMLRPSAALSGSYAFRNTTFDANYSMAVGHNVEYAPELSVGPAMSTVATPAGVRILDVWMKTFWEWKSYTLLTNIVNGATTPVITYPNDWTNSATVQADYAGTNGQHGILIVGSPNTTFGALPYATGNGLPDYVGAFTVNFQSGGFTITNTSGLTWTSGSVLWIILDRGDTSMDPDLLIDVDQTDIALYRPTSPQSLTGGVRSTLFDFTRRLRPSSGFAIAPAGSNAAGALLP